MKIKIAIAEDNKRFRTAFLRLMKSEGDLEFIIEAENGTDLLLQLESKIPDIVLMDIRMPITDGFQATRIIHKKYPQIKVVAFTQFDLEENIIEMSRIGVKSFIGKNQSEKVPGILKIIHQGGMYYPDEVATILRKYLNRMSSFHPKCPIPLSQMEKILLQSMCQGKSPTQIGDVLNKSPRTIERYRNDLYQKFNVSNHQQLIYEASKWSFLE